KSAPVGHIRRHPARCGPGKSVRVIGSARPQACRGISQSLYQRVEPARFREAHMGKTAWLLLVPGLLGAAPEVPAAELIFPQNRNAYYSQEPIEFAVAGVGQAATVELVPQKAGPAPLKFEVKGPGPTAVVVLPPGALAPSDYKVRLDGKDAATLTVA